jgi:hypothetical protein
MQLSYHFLQSKRGVILRAYELDRSAMGKRVERGFSIKERVFPREREEVKAINRSSDR